MATRCNCDPFERQLNTAEFCSTCFFRGDGHIISPTSKIRIWWTYANCESVQTWPGSGKTTDELEIVCAANTVPVPGYVPGIPGGTRQYSVFTLNNCKINFYIPGWPIRIPYRTIPYRTVQYSITRACEWSLVVSLNYVQYSSVKFITRFGWPLA
jgi:hypothetical protein